MLRDRILSHKLKVSPVDVPELGEGYYVRSLSGADAARVRQTVSGSGEVEGDIWFALLTLSDAHGKRVLTDDDYPQFSALPYSVITTITRAAMLLNGMGVEGHDAAKKA